MVRSVWKGPFCHPTIVRLVRSMAAKKVQQKAAIQVHNRASMILPEFIGFRFAVHNGKKYEPLEVTEQHVGYKFGEFSFTRKAPNSVYDSASNTKVVLVKKKK